MPETKEGRKSAESKTNEDRGLVTYDPEDPSTHVGLEALPEHPGRGPLPPPEKGPADLAEEAGHAGQAGEERPRRGAGPKERLANSDPIVQ